METAKTPQVRAVVMVDDIADLRKAIKVGDIITETVMTDKLGDKLVRPKKIKHKVIARYPHLVEVENPTGLPRKTLTYVDILLMGRKAMFNNFKNLEAIKN